MSSLKQSQLYLPKSCPYHPAAIAHRQAQLLKEFNHHHLKWNYNLKTRRKIRITHWGQESNQLLQLSPIISVNNWYQDHHHHSISHNLSALHEKNHLSEASSASDTSKVMDIQDQSFLLLRSCLVCQWIQIRLPRLLEGRILLQMAAGAPPRMALSNQFK
jgi:hypothetical protein